MRRASLPFFALAAIPAAILPAIAGAAERPPGPSTETGSISGAEYRIDFPAEWNGGLVMYAHGYEVVAPKRRGYNTRIVEAATSLGYAIAQSQYDVQGWAAREGVLQTDILRRHFEMKYGKPSPVVIAGDSQGGAITFKTIEQFPEVYDGALSMCAVAEPALKFFKERVFDMRLLFDYYFPGLPGSVVDFPPGQNMLVSATKAAELVKANPEMAEKYRRMFELPDAASIAPVIAFWTEILREMTVRTGGQAFDNRDTIYSGTDDNAKLNREIKRFAADPKAQEYLRQWVTPTGAISDPVIALHTLVDQLIPASAVKYYEQATTIRGTGDLYVQYFVDRSGHCNFTVAEIREALRRLSVWIKEGKRPEPGDLTIPEEGKP